MNNSTSDTHFDAIVIGSGFGGSVSAYRLAEAELSVCVLERGKPYPHQRKLIKLRQRTATVLQPG